MGSPRKGNIGRISFSQKASQGGNSCYHASMIAILVGSLRKESTNLMLAKEAAQILEQKTEVDIIVPDLPLFSEDWERDPEEPALPEAEELRSCLRRASGLLLCSPEYDRLPSAITLNALHWASRPPLPPLVGTPTMLAGVSSGVRGTRNSRPQLRLALERVGAQVLEEEIFVGLGHETFASGEDRKALRHDLGEKMSLLLHATK